MARYARTNRLFILLLSGGGFIAGCQRERVLAPVFEGARPVLFSILDPLEPASVRLSRTVPLNTPDADDTAVPDAVVTLYENTSLKETLRYTNNGIYQSPTGLKPLPGKEYFISVVHPQLRSAKSAAVRIPERPVNPEVVLGQQQLTSPGLLPARELSFRLNDDPTSANEYYAIRITARSGSGEDLRVLTWPLDGADDIDNPCRDLKAGYWLLPDRCFANGRTRVRLGVETDGRTALSQQVPVRRLDITVLAIAPDYYRYLSQKARLSSAEQLFFDPNPLFTNVNGGYGVVGATNTARFVLSL